MGTRHIMESRTTIFYMAGFGMFVMLSYMLVVAPEKEEQKCYINSLYAGEQVDERQPSAVNEPLNEKHYEPQLER